MRNAAAFQALRSRCTAPHRAGASCVYARARKRERVGDENVGERSIDRLSDARLEARHALDGRKEGNGWNAAGDSRRATPRAELC